MYYRPMAPYQRVPMAGNRYPGPPPRSGGGGGCYITTAVCENLGMSDDCEILTILRDFRDNYMVIDVEGRKLVKNYYISAPKIVKTINQMENKDEIYNKLMYNYILPAYRNIKDGNNKKAFELYKAGVIFAKCMAGI